MWFIFFLVLHQFIAGALSFSVNPRVIGGNEVTDRSQFAYQAVLFWKESYPICGGVVISERHVLTAAHCSFIVQNNIKVELPYYEIFSVVGNLELYNRTIMKKAVNRYMHEDFDMNGLHHDIALIEIEGTFGTWTDFVSPISLKTDETLSGNCVVSGFGTVSTTSSAMSYKLSYVEVPVVDFATCKTKYLNEGIDIGNKVICAGTVGKDSCTGDSGGPLVCDNKLAGLVSFGKGCAGEFPGVNTEVAKYTEWIEFHKSLITNSTTSSSERNISNVSILFLFFVYAFYNVKNIFC